MSHRASDLGQGYEPRCLIQLLSQNNSSQRLFSILSVNYSCPGVLCYVWKKQDKQAHSELDKAHGRHNTELHVYIWASAWANSNCVWQKCRSNDPPKTNPNTGKWLVLVKFSAYHVSCKKQVHCFAQILFEINI